MEGDVAMYSYWKDKTTVDGGRCILQLRRLVKHFEQMGIASQNSSIIQGS
jgi:hypothetical protein